MTNPAIAGLLILITSFRGFLAVFVCDCLIELSQMPRDLIELFHDLGLRLEKPAILMFL